MIEVGAGAACSVIANRLSAEPAGRVALVEAGPSDRGFPLKLKTSLPIGNISAPAMMIGEPAARFVRRSAAQPDTTVFHPQTESTA